MKRINNKGFAFSTLLYGLALMGMMLTFLTMSIVQINRQNNKLFMKSIEDELNRYSMTKTDFVFTFQNHAQEYIVPSSESGWYKLELWGASKSSNNGVTGLGSYTSGVIYLRENDRLNFYIGMATATGEASRIAINKGTEANIMVAAGGSSSSSTICGYGGSAAVTLSGVQYKFLNGLVAPTVHNGNGKARLRKVSSNNAATSPIPGSQIRGNYYIFAENSNNRVAEPRSSDTIIETRLFSGNSSQVWTIEPIGGNYYKIFNTNSGNALQIDNGTEYEDSTVSAPRPFSGLNYNWEKWQIQAATSGTYTICSGFGTCIMLNDGTTTSTTFLKTALTRNTGDSRQRFKLILADY